MTTSGQSATHHGATSTAAGWLHRPLSIEGSKDGVLAGRRFAVKDVIDVEGVPTSAGSPAWEATHLVPLRHAPSVQALLDAGATLVGKAVSDELAYSVNGTNPHHGMPPNPAAPGHVPGGSSSGSGSAVATGDVDFSLGTDTGGSVRVPASYCGVFGIRPTWGATDTTRVVHLAPSFDTVGWFARDAATLRSVGQVLLPPSEQQESDPLSLVPLAEAFDIARPDVATAVLEGLRSRFGDVVTEPRRLGIDLRAWASVRYTIQTYETWQLHGAWAQPHLSKLGHGVRSRLEACEATTLAQYDDARRQRDEIGRMLSAAVADHEVLCLPTTPTPAPAVRDLADLTAQVRADVFALGATAGLWGGPEASMPGTIVGGLPIGMSLVGRPGSDHRILDHLRTYAPSSPPDRRSR